MYIYILFFNLQGEAEIKLLERLCTCGTLKGKCGSRKTAFVEDGNGSKDAHERVADSSDRQWEIRWTLLGKRGQVYVQDPVEARSQEGLQTDGGCSSLQGRHLTPVSTSKAVK